MRAKPLLVCLGLAASCLGAAVVACSGTTTEAAKTITGVLVRAETLTVGRGCGPSPSQVYKYVAVVLGDSSADPTRPTFDQPIAASLFDCFADGAFVDLPPSATGSSTYKIQLYVYNQPDYAASAGAIQNARTDTGALAKTAPTWTTACFATQVEDVQSLAVCDPLQFGLGGVGGSSQASVRLETASFALAEGGSVACAPPPDGGAPDSGDAGTDAEAGGGGAATLAGGYGNVRITPSAGGLQGAPTTVRCPDPYVLDSAVPLQTYALGVEVFSPDGAAVVGRTTCSATARAGLTSLASCAPMQ